MRARPELLDLCCCAGGASFGYDLAGFKVTGVDIRPQKRYPFRFIQADALDYVRNHKRYAVIHASPPCQMHSNMTKQSGRQNEHPDLIAMLRLSLQSIGKPYVIENVEGAPLIDPVTLCGTAFGKPLKRHRLFESNVKIEGTECNHEAFPKDILIYNHGWKYTQFVPIYGSSGSKAAHLWAPTMGTPWMTHKEMSEAIPPYYTEFIGKQILKALEVAA